MQCLRFYHHLPITHISLSHSLSYSKVNIMQFRAKGHQELNIMSFPNTETDILPGVTGSILSSLAHGIMDGRLRCPKLCLGAFGLGLGACDDVHPRMCLLTRCQEASFYGSEGSPAWVWFGQTKLLVCAETSPRVRASIGSEGGHLLLGGWDGVQN